MNVHPWSSFVRKSALPSSICRWEQWVDYVIVRAIAYFMASVLRRRCLISNDLSDKRNSFEFQIMQ